MKIIILILLSSLIGISCSDSQVAVQDVNEKIIDQTNSKYPDAKILSVIKEEENNATQYEVNIANGAELLFDKNFNLIKVDESKMKAAAPVSHGAKIQDGKKINRNSSSVVTNISSLPEATQAYLNNNYPNIIPKRMEQDDDGYEILLNDSTTIEFDVSGKFISLELDK